MHLPHLCENSRWNGFRFRAYRNYFLLLTSSASTFTAFLTLGTFQPEEMTAIHSTLTSLASFRLQFQSPRSRSYRRCSSPTPTLLPVLTSLRFKGLSTYFEDFVAGIDAPQISTLFVGFFDEIQSGTPKLVQFICRTPRLKELKSASVTFRPLGQSLIRDT